VEADALVASSDRFHEQLKKLWPTGELHCEVPIEFVLEGAFVRGSMDALVLTSSEAIIIDHKASECRAGDAQVLVDTYRHQLRAYEEAVRRVYPGHKVRSFLHNPDGWMAEVGIVS
jgi:ATP-dependent exoDNAse (exonuclease V) beta subunit